MDWRYQAMKDKAPKLYLLTNLFGIQLFPTSIVFIQLILGIIVIKNNPEVNFLTMIGSLIIVVAAIIQFVSDQQMKNFKERTKGEKNVSKKVFGSIQDILIILEKLWFGGGYISYIYP